jgi:ribose transport system permease protein
VTIGSIATVPGWNWRRLLARQHRLLVAVTAFLVIFIFVRLVSSGSLSYFELSSLSTNTGALALAAMGETVVFLLGGIDLSAGATLSLVNVTLASQNGDSFLSQITLVLTGLAIGGLVGAFNGFFVAYMRLQAVVVTLASMFIILSLSLLIMPNPGGHVPEGLSKFFTGDLISGSFPAALAVILFALVVWAVIKNSPFGTALYAVGGNVGAARASGISVAWTQFLGYVMAGLFYGAAGVMLSAQTAAGDPLVGRDLIVPILTAVILGGSQIGAGGGCLGTVFAAFTLVLISDLLLVLDISSSYTPIVESAVLVLAVISGLIGRNTALAEHIGNARLLIAGMRARSLPRMHPAKWEPRPTRSYTLRLDPELPKGALHRWLWLNRETVRLVLPAWALCLLVYAAIVVVTHGGALSAYYFNSLLTLALFLVVLGLGQGAVVLTGGLDLSVPYTISFTGVVLAAICNGHNAPASWAIPLALAIGTGVGLINGLGIVLIGIPSIVMTLAIGGVMQGAGLLYTGGMPTGSAPPMLRWVYNTHIFGFAPAVWFLLVFAIGATLLLHRTTFGRNVLAVGNSVRVARLSGTRVDLIVLGVYVLSGFCSALVGVLMTGFSGISFLSMGVPYLLPAIAAVLVGGSLATGGRGHFLGILGGALLLTAVGTLVSGAQLPIAVRDIVYGVVVLGAVLSLRERTE